MRLADTPVVLVAGAEQQAAVVTGQFDFVFVRVDGQGELVDEVVAVDGGNQPERGLVGLADRQ